MNTHRLAELLQHYDSGKGQYLLQGFTNGFELHYTGSRKFQDCKNLCSAIDNPTEFCEKILKEIRLGRILSSFKTPPLPDLQCSPLGLVPKKGNPGKLRLIMHLSHPRGDSINDFIPKEFSIVCYKSFDVAIKLCLKYGKNAKLAKMDLNSAYCHLCMSRKMLSLLGIKIDNEYYVETCLPFSASESCAIFEKFSTWLEWETTRRANEPLSHYLDDFIFIHSYEEICNQMLQHFLDICTEINFPVAHHKTEGPCTCLVFLGLLIDTIRMVIGIPQDKIDRALDKIDYLLNAKKVKVSTISSLCGLLNFICMAVRPGHPFIRCLYDIIGDLPQHYHVSITKDAKKDLSIWKTFFNNYNCLTPFWVAIPVYNSTISLFTDSSANPSLSWGTYFDGKWSQARCPQGFVCEGCSIALLEFIPIIIALEMWKEELHNKFIIFRSDNQVACHIVNNQMSCCSMIMMLVHHLVMTALHYNIIFKAYYLISIDNRIADALSRFQMDRFRALAPLAEPQSTDPPSSLWPLSKDTLRNSKL